MAGPYTWAQMTFLTAQERQGMETFAALGAQLAAKGLNEANAPIEGLDPTLSLSNAKAANNVRRALADLWGPAEAGAKYTAMWHRWHNQKDFETSNP